MIHDISYIETPFEYWITRFVRKRDSKRKHILKSKHIFKCLYTYSDDKAIHSWNFEINIYTMSEYYQRSALSDISQRKSDIIHWSCNTYHQTHHASSARFRDIKTRKKPFKIIGKTGIAFQCILPVDFPTKCARNKSKARWISRKNQGSSWSHI